MSITPIALVPYWYQVPDYRYLIVVYTVYICHRNLVYTITVLVSMITGIATVHVHVYGTCMYMYTCIEGTAIGMNASTRRMARILCIDRNEGSSAAQ